VNEIFLTLGGSVKLVLTTETAPRGTCVIKTTYNGFVTIAKGFEMSYNLPADHFVNVQVSYVDSRGNPAAVDGPVTWAVAPEGIVTVTPDSVNSSECTITPVGALGNAQVSATADADLGEGVTTLVTLLDVSVVAGEAVAGTIAPVGPPEPLPAG